MAGGECGEGLVVARGAMVVIVAVIISDQGIMAIAIPIRHKNFTCRCQQKWLDRLGRLECPSS